MMMVRWAAGSFRSTTRSTAMADACNRVLPTSKNEELSFQEVNTQSFLRDVNGHLIFEPANSGVAANKACNFFSSVCQQHLLRLTLLLTELLYRMISGDGFLPRAREDGSVLRQNAPICCGEGTWIAEILPHRLFCLFVLPDQP